jgi:hypothetical protein
MNCTDGHKKAVEWITACLVLYNVVLPLDNWVPSNETSNSGTDDLDPAEVDDYSASDKRMALYYHVMSKLKN